MRRYNPQVYPGAVTLFKVAMPLAVFPSGESAPSGQNANMIQDPTMGWGELAAGGGRIVDVPGEHHSIIISTNVETLALRSRDCLESTETIVGGFDSEMCRGIIGTPNL